MRRLSLAGHPRGRPDAPDHERRGGYTKRFPWIVEVTRKLRQTRFVIDGEAVLLGVDGVSDVPIVLAMLGAWRFLGSRCSNRSLSYRLIHT